MTVRLNILRSLSVHRAAWEGRDKDRDEETFRDGYVVTVVVVVMTVVVVVVEVVVVTEGRNNCVATKGKNRKIPRLFSVFFCYYSHIVLVWHFNSIHLIVCVIIE